MKLSKPELTGTEHGPAHVQRPCPPTHNSSNAPPEANAHDGLPAAPMTSSDFLLGSARTKMLQKSLLMGLAVVLAALLIQVALEQPDKHVRQPLHAMSEP